MSPNRPMNLRRRLAAAIFCLQVLTNGAALAATEAPTQAASPPVAATGEANSATVTAVGLIESSPETGGLYRFVVQPHAEPSRTQLLLGGLLAAIFLIRNRFRAS